MKNLVSLIVFALVFLGLGAMALMAAPGGADLVAEFNPSESAGSAPQTNSAAPAATNKYNMIALPLDSTATITPFTASGLASYHGSSVTQVLKWNNSLQTFESFIPGVTPPVFPFDFGLDVGGAYMLMVDSTSANVLSFVGDVPAQGTVASTLTPGSAACSFDTLSVPLDRSDLTKASQLAADVLTLNEITEVGQILTWNPTLQTFDSFIPGVTPPVDPFDFGVRIGYPYMICTKGTASVDWK